MKTLVLCAILYLTIVTAVPIRVQKALLELRNAAAESSTGQSQFPVDISSGAATPAAGSTGSATGSVAAPYIRTLPDSDYTDPTKSHEAWYKTGQLGQTDGAPNTYHPYVHPVPYPFQSGAHPLPAHYIRENGEHHGYDVPAPYAHNYIHHEVNWVTPDVVDNDPREIHTHVVVSASESSASDSSASRLFPAVVLHDDAPATRNTFTVHPAVLGIPADPNHVAPSAVPTVTPVTPVVHIPGHSEVTVTHHPDQFIVPVIVSSGPTVSTTHTVVYPSHLEKSSEQQPKLYPAQIEKASDAEEHPKISHHLKQVSKELAEHETALLELQVHISVEHELASALRSLHVRSEDLRQSLDSLATAAEKHL